MVALKIWYRYFVSKFQYSLTATEKAYAIHEILENEMLSTLCRNLFTGRLTFLHLNKEEKMGSDMIGTLLVRKIPVVDPRSIRVNDVVLLRDPSMSRFNNFLVRRLAAIEGDEMISTDEEDEPFFIEKDYCWVLGASDKLRQLEKLYDSRTFGPVHTRDIAGRVIYCLRNAVDHGPVTNSEISNRQDSPILEVELDIDEMIRDRKA